MKIDPHLIRKSLIILLDSLEPREKIVFNIDCYEIIIGKTPSNYKIRVFKRTPLPSDKPNPFYERHPTHYRVQQLNVSIYREKPLGGRYLRSALRFFKRHIDYHQLYLEMNKIIIERI